MVLAELLAGKFFLNFRHEFFGFCRLNKWLGLTPLLNNIGINYSKMFRLNLSLRKFQEKALVERRPATKEHFGLVDVGSRYQHITAHQAQFGYPERLIIWVSL